MGYKWDKKLHVSWKLRQCVARILKFPAQYGIQELIAVLKIDEYISSQTTFPHSKCSMLVEFG